MNIVKILIPRNGLFPLSYITEYNLEIGQIVEVPFRAKNIFGIVWEINCMPEDYNFTLKKISTEQRINYKISKNLISLIKRTAQYYISELGTIAKLVLPVSIDLLKDGNIISDDFSKIKLAKLSAAQETILQDIKKETKPILLQGITGSGKTEIYFYLIEDIIKSGKQALILLPEIALSNQIINRFKNRFNIDPLIWHSKVSAGKKKKIFHKIINGEAKIIIGTRSSLFLPYKNLGLIVIDEEHDPSYKQSEGVVYNARDMAVLRSNIENFKILLISATPSIESIYNAKNGKYKIYKLMQRFNTANLPKVNIVDMNKQQLEKNLWLSNDVIENIKITIAKKQQVLIFLNRRGYAPLLLCKKCHYKFCCKKCSSSLVFHKSSNKLECHHCGFFSIIPNNCPECEADKDDLILCGPGIERIKEEVENIFTEANIALVSKENNFSKKDIGELLSDMENGNIDILIGTQIITKGYHFPKLSLVVIVDADIAMFGGDLRAPERAFQLLHQVSGRAGREKEKGNVMVQTYYPDNKLMKFLQNQDYENFIKLELESREEFAMPPYGRMANIIVTGKKQDKTFDLAKYLVNIAPHSSAKIMGPAETLVHKIANKYRYKILVLVDRKFDLQKYISFWLGKIKISSSYHIKIDIDPQHFI